MSTLVDKPAVPIIDGESLEKGNVSSQPVPSSEPAFTWSSPGPLFRSSRHAIIFSLIVWMMFVTVEYVFKINTTSYEWISPNLALIHEADYPRQIIADHAYMVHIAHCMSLASCAISTLASNRVFDYSDEIHSYPTCYMTHATCYPAGRLLFNDSFSPGDVTISREHGQARSHPVSGALDLTTTPTIRLNRPWPSFQEFRGNYFLSTALLLEYSYNRLLSFYGLETRQFSKQEPTIYNICLYQPPHGLCASLHTITRARNVIALARRLSHQSLTRSRSPIKLHSSMASLTRRASARNMKHEEESTPALDTPYKTRTRGSAFGKIKTLATLGIFVISGFLGYNAGNLGRIVSTKYFGGSPGTSGPLAVAYLKGPNSNVTGVIHFSQPSPTGPVFIIGELKNLDPNYGDARDGCMSSGSHYSECLVFLVRSRHGNTWTKDPFGVPHGGPKDLKRHVGDLGNIRSDADGVARLDFSDNIINLVGPLSIVGRGTLVGERLVELLSCRKQGPLDQLRVAWTVSYPELPLVPGSPCEPYKRGGGRDFPSLTFISRNLYPVFLFDNTLSFIMFGKVKFVAALALLTFSSASAKAVLKDANGTQIGVVNLYQASNLEPVKITADLKGLGAEGKKGFHVHFIISEFGDLSGGCASAGGHFNPLSKQHGAPTDAERHAGDLGNIVTGPDGTSKVEMEDKQISLYSGHRNIVGRAIVLHAGEDDLGLGGQSDSKTTGHAGARLACGVIGYAPAPTPAA
ncbi:copper/zinc superoxide dismutase domain-containing protein [Rhizoctonia solani AG-1 IA]|uniref:Copper/zinc superoxide dismutase domain-containing protein n=1 Tax=Thanatephorus cucumeris (strain AG1-IA) TaxID=983506 RepID=L8WXL9_THACA|nr:copper/zinc superoxide dismutase domain-containing protein [Rhizoctonia solani AG-1 IA]